MSLSDTKYLMDITSRPDLVFLKGDGSWLEDQHGKRYLDMLQGWAVNCLGHNPKPIIEALTRAKPSY
ncbi:acetylornithine transaminase [Oligella ureolytica]